MRLHVAIWHKDGVSTSLLRQWRRLRELTSGLMQFTVMTSGAHVLAACLDLRCRVQALLLDIEDVPMDTLALLGRIRREGGAVLPTLLLVRDAGNIKASVQGHIVSAMELGATQVLERPHSGSDLKVLASRLAALVARHTKADLVFNEVRTSISDASSAASLHKRHMAAWRKSQGGANKGNQGGDSAFAVAHDDSVRLAAKNKVGSNVIDAFGITGKGGYLSKQEHKDEQEVGPGGLGRVAQSGPAAADISPQRLAEMAASAAGRWTSHETLADKSEVTAQARTAANAGKVISEKAAFGIAAHGADAYTDAQLFPHLAKIRAAEAAEWGGFFAAEGGDDADQPSDAYQGVILAALAEQHTLDKNTAMQNTAAQNELAPASSPRTITGDSSYGGAAGGGELDAWGAGAAGSRGAVASLDPEWASPARANAVRKLRVVHHDMLQRGLRRTALTSQAFAPLSSPYLDSQSGVSGGGSTASTGLLTVALPTEEGRGIVQAMTETGGLQRMLNSMPALAAKHRVSALAVGSRGGSRGGSSASSRPPSPAAGSARFGTHVLGASSSTSALGGVGGGASGMLLPSDGPRATPQRSRRQRPPASPITGGLRSSASQGALPRMSAAAGAAFASAATKRQARGELAASRGRLAAGTPFLLKTADEQRMDTAWMGWMAFDLLKGLPQWPTLEHVSPFNKAYKWLQRGLGHLVPIATADVPDGASIQQRTLHAALQGLNGGSAPKRRGGGSAAPLQDLSTAPSEKQGGVGGAISGHSADEALIAFTRAAKSDPRCVVAHHFRAVAQLVQGQFEEALLSLHAAVSSAPHKSTAALQLRYGGSGSSSRSTRGVSSRKLGSGGSNSANLHRAAGSPAPSQSSNGPMEGGHGSRIPSAQAVVELTQKLWVPPPSVSYDRGGRMPKTPPPPKSDAPTADASSQSWGNVTAQPGRLGLDSAVAWQPPPLVAAALYNRALARASLGDLLAAYEDVGGCLQLERGHSGALRLRALLRRREGNFKGAVSDYVEATLKGDASSPGDAISPGHTSSPGSPNKERMSRVQELSTLLKPGTRLTQMLRMETAVAGADEEGDGTTSPQQKRLQAELQSQGAWPSPVRTAAGLKAGPGKEAAVHLVLKQEQEFARKLEANRLAPVSSGASLPAQQADASPKVTHTARQLQQEGTEQVQRADLFGGMLREHLGVAAGVATVSAVRAKAEVLAKEGTALQVLGGTRIKEDRHISDDDASAAAAISAGSAVHSPRSQALERLGADSHTLPQYKHILTGQSDMYTALMCKDTILGLALAVRGNRRSETDIAAITGALTPLLWFRLLPPEEQKEFAVRCSRRAFHHGSVIVQERAPMPFFCVVLSGTATVKVNVADSDIAVGQLRAGDIYGHLSLLFGASRTLTVMSDGSLELIVLPAADFYSMKLDGVFKAQLTRYMGVIKSTGAFTGFSDEELLKLASTATLRSYAKGTVLVRQGDVPSALYVLTRGVVRAVKDTNVLGDLDRQVHEAETQLKGLEMGGTYHASMRHGAKLDFRPAGSAPVAIPTEDTTQLARGGVDPATTLEATRLRELTDHETGVELRNELTPSAVQLQVSQLHKRIEALKERRKQVLSSVRRHTAVHQGELSSGTLRKGGRGEFPGASARSRQSTLPAEQHAGMGATENADPNRILKRRVLLEWALPPFMFGELAVLSPWKSLEPGSIIADTYVEVLVVDKGSLPHHYMSRARLDVVRSKAIQWPKEDTVLLQRYLQQSQWSQYKSQILAKTV